MVTWEISFGITSRRRTFAFSPPHAHKPAIDDLSEMIRELKLLAYNVAARVFSAMDTTRMRPKSHCWTGTNGCGWTNPPAKSRRRRPRRQIEGLAKEFAQLLVCAGRPTIEPMHSLGYEFAQN